MTRVRLALALLFAALALPVALLVSRALDSAAVEERVRHEAIAARVFDEMERSLSDFLAREEARAPDEWRFYRDAGPGVRNAAARSPLSWPASEPFVVAHFEVRADGRVETPLVPADPERAALAGDWPPPAREQDARERALAVIAREVAPFWRDVDAQRRGLAHAPASPGAGAPLAKQSAAAPAPAEPSAYDVLESLNVAVRKREERRQEQQVRVAALPPARGALLTESSERPAAEADAASLERADAGAESGGLRDELAGADAPGARGRPGPAPAPAMPAARAEPLPAAPPARGSATSPRKAVLEPLAGLPLGERHWMLHRTVVSRGEPLRQGLVIDREALGGWLARDVLGASALAARARVRFASDGELAGDGAGHRARHRFAEPFAGFEAELLVAPLAGESSVPTVLLLAGALGAVALLGLLAVDRMASLVVDFAERRAAFVASVSHELKTPLTAIRLHGEMLRDGLVASEAKRAEYYRTITDESERLSRLIDNVLEFSRLEQGQRRAATSVGSPAPVVLDSVERLRPHAARAGFSLRAELEEPLAAVRFDRDALAQMLFNLIDNALKYAARAERREIVVRCAPAAAGGVSVSVRDFGPGVPREQLARVFEPFHRIDGELERTTRGSGIGLSLVRQLGESMGASVAGELPPDGGFRVRIELAAAAG